MHDAKTIGNTIRSISKRQSEYCTQEKFAEAIGTTPETVSNIERGNVVLTTKTLVKIAETFNVSTDEILGVVRR